MGKLREKYENFVNAMGDFTGQTPYIELHGDGEMLMSGCRSIVDYHSGKIVADTFCGNVTMCGNNLSVEVFRGDILCIKGKISYISFGGQIDAD